VIIAPTRQGSERHAKRPDAVVAIASDPDDLKRIRYTQCGSQVSLTTLAVN
jgi:hypothetical protein